MKIAPVLLVVSVLVVALCVREAGATESTRVSPSLDDLAWLAGHWSTEDDAKLSMEELWMAPKGGVMLGLHRDVVTDGERLASFEYLRIVRGADGEIDYVASPGGRSSTSFRLLSATENEAVFENPEHDFPQRIVYSVKDEVLTARIENLEGTKATSWEWKRR